LQLVVPALWARAVQLREEFTVPGSAQLGFDLGGERLRPIGIPLRQEPGVYQDVAPLNMYQREAPQPVKQRVAIGRCKHLAKRVVSAPLGKAVRKRKKMQIVVAEHCHRALAQFVHEAQRRERRRSTVDEIADKPQAVLAAIEVDRR